MCLSDASLVENPHAVWGLEKGRQGLGTQNIAMLGLSGKTVT